MIKLFSPVDECGIIYDAERQKLDSLLHRFI
jgi:hypothetical protein